MLCASMVLLATKIDDEGGYADYLEFCVSLTCEALYLLLGEIAEVVIFIILSLWGGNARSRYDHQFLKVVWEEQTIVSASTSAIYGDYG